MGLFKVNNSSSFKSKLNIYTLQLYYCLFEVNNSSSLNQN